MTSPWKTHCTSFHRFTLKNSETLHCDSYRRVNLLPGELHRIMRALRLHLGWFLHTHKCAYVRKSQQLSWLDIIDKFCNH